MLKNQELYRRGVGAFLFNHDKKIFMGRRITPKNCWQMPQGGIDNNEAPSEAIFRELEEEIGTNKVEIISQTTLLRYKLPSNLRNKFWNAQYVGQEQIWFALKFLATNQDINLNFSNHPEFIDYKWVSPPEIINLIVNFKKAMYQEILNQLQSYLT